jgi:cardiolipin synthase
MSMSRLAVDPDPAPGIHLLAGGTAAFDRILRRIDRARSSILIRCFAWRDDETGEIVARHLLRAAERGVSVTILKDRVGMYYEYFEGSRQSFFHKQLDLAARVQTWFLMAVYGEWGSFAQRENALATALIAHPNVTVTHEEKRFDHAKVYVFDDEAMILGGMGIGDDFRLKNVDFMVEIEGREAVARFAERDAGRAGFDARRRLDYLLHSFRGAEAMEAEAPSLVEHRLAMIRGARERLTIAMAYMGDGRITDALCDAVTRGVSLTLLTSQRSNVIADLNLRTCDDLLRRTGAPSHLRIVLSPRMVHGKAIVVDGARVDLGSANFTTLSHGAFEEVNVYCQDSRLASEVEEAIEVAIREGQPAASRVRYRPIFMLVERAITQYQARRRKARPTPPV